MKSESTIVRYTSVLFLLTVAACTTPPSKQESESSEQSQSQSQQSSSSSSSSSSSQSSPAQQQADPGSQQSTARAQQNSTPSTSSTQSSTSQQQADPGEQDAAQGDQTSTASASATTNSTTSSVSADSQQNPASGQQQSGQKSDDDILAEAMEVFNTSMQSGQPDAGTQSQQGDAGTLEKTVDGSADQSGRGEAGPGSPATDQASAGSSASGQISTTAGTAGYPGGFLPPGQGSAGNLPSAAGGAGGLEGINTDTQGQRVIVLVPGSGAETDAERVETLDRQLGEKMGEFDGIILSRRQEVIAKSNEGGAGDIGTVGGSSGGFGDGSGVESAPLLTASRDPNNMQTRGQMPDASGDNRKGDYRGSGQGNSNVPDDISDGSDDDIVARQLREAAMQEQDAELREKLWDEYRKYKAGVQAKR